MKELSMAVLCLVFYVGVISFVMAIVLSCVQFYVEEREAVLPDDKKFRSDMRLSLHKYFRYAVWMMGLPAFIVGAIELVRYVFVNLH